MSAYYNEHDPFAAAWLRELIKAGHIADGEVDEGSIEDVSPIELAGFTQCHFFAGIGGWSRALRLAGWPDDRPVWTGSCPANLSARQAKEKGMLTSGTYGQHSSTSSTNDALMLSLVSRLKQRLSTDGSTLFKMTWKESVTPSGRLVYLLRASARSTSEQGHGSWPTPRREDSESTGAHRGIPDTLHSATQLSPWPTPTAYNPEDKIEKRAERGKKYGFGSALTATMAANLASWPTPNGIDGHRGVETNEARIARGAHTGTTLSDAAAWTTPNTTDVCGVRAMDGKRSGGLNTQASWATPTAPAPKDTDNTAGRARPREGYGQDLPIQAGLASWATPQSRDYKSNEGSEEFHLSRLEHSRGKPLSEQAHLLSGPAPSGSTAATEKPGQLNPAHSRWLMGYLTVWDDCAAMVTPLSRRSRKPSSKHT